MIDVYIDEMDKNYFMKAATFGKSIPGLMSACANNNVSLS
jgi:hypothetical protein